MSWENVFSYFSQKLESVGCSEWVVPFDEENIPSSLIDKSFIQSVVNITGDNMTNQALETIISHEVRIFYKGFRDPRNAEKEALAKASEAVKACVSHVAQGGDFKGVYFTDLSLEPLSDDINDNVVVAIIRFDVRMFLCIE
jgi:hypothetical protein